MSSFGLSGRTVLVTGAARGIGLETARLMSARGASLVLTDLDAEALPAAEEAMSGPALTIAGDATDREALAETVARAAERFGGLDAVVANAGIAPPPRPLGSMDPSEFERVVETDLLGVYRTVHATLPMITERRGQVVLIASIYAFAPGMMVSPYAASKAGVEQLGRALRIELAPHGAGATVVYPGFIDTKMVREAFADPIASGLQGALPGFVTRKITPAALAERIVAGVERRAPRVVAPRWFSIWLALRGALNPALDAGLVRDPRIAELVARAEALGAQASSSSPRESA